MQMVLSISMGERPLPRLILVVPEPPATPQRPTAGSRWGYPEVESQYILSSSHVGLAGRIRESQPV